MKLKSLLALPLAAAVTLAGMGTAQAANVLVRPDGIYLRCDQCGTVQAIDQNISQSADHGTAGAIIGAIAGGVLGNQVGRGNGRKLATVGGAVGGGFAGNALGKGRTSESFTVRLRMGNGGHTNITVPDASSLRVGDLVQVDPNGSIMRIQ